MRTGKSSSKSLIAAGRKARVANARRVLSEYLAESDGTAADLAAYLRINRDTPEARAKLEEFSASAEQYGITEDFPWPADMVAALLAMAREDEGAGATRRPTPGQGSFFPTIPTATWRPNDDGSRSMTLGRYHLTARPEGRGRDKTWTLEIRRDTTTGPYLDRQKWLANLNDAQNAALEMIRRDTDPYHATRGTGAPSEKTALEHVVIRDGIAYVRFNWRPETNSGNRKGWGKIVTGVDRTKRGGYAIDGDFMRSGAQEFPAGTVFVQSDPTGSVKNNGKDYSLAVVDPVRSKNGTYLWVPGFIEVSQVSASFLDATEEALANAPAVQAATLEVARSPVRNPTRDLIDLYDFLPDPIDSYDDEIPRGVPGIGPTATAKKGRTRAKRPRVSIAPTTPIAVWRKATTAYLAELRRKRPNPEKRAAALTSFWAATLDLAGRFGLNVESWLLDPSIAAEADRWWVEQSWTTSGPVGIVDALAASARSAATRLEAGARRDADVEPAAVLAWIALVLKLLQAAERIPGLALATAPTTTEPAKPTRKPAKRGRKERDPCTAPRPRRGDDARCRGDWGDSIVSCVVRSGGLHANAPEVAELVHAAGDRRHVPPRLLRRNGKPWYKIAAILTEEGYVAPDEHGRPDEAAALQRLVDALRGEYGGALPELNACALRRIEEDSIAEQRREWEERALAEMEAMAEAGELLPGEYEIEGDYIPF